MNTDLENEVLQLHAEICAGLIDPKRIMILYQLSSGPCNVNELVNSLKMQQPMVSRYLKVLRERGMVRVERQGAEVIYSVSDGRLIQALDML